MWPVRVGQTLVWAAILIAVTGGLRAWLVDSDPAIAEAAAERAVAIARQAEADPAATTARVERLAERFITLWSQGLPTDGLTTDPIPLGQPQPAPFLVEVANTIRANQPLPSGDLIWRVTVRTATQHQVSVGTGAEAETVEEWFDLRAVSNPNGVWVAGAPTPVRTTPPTAPAPFMPVADAATQTVEDGDPQLVEDLQGFFTAWLTEGERLDLWTSADADLDALRQEAQDTVGGRITEPRVTAVRGPAARADGSYTVGVRVEGDRVFEWTLRMVRNGPRWLVVETVLVPPINPTATTTTTTSEDTQ